MADDVLELTRKCAEAIGYKIDSVVGTCCYHYNANGSAYKYDPASDPAQAFELLCWLAERGCVMVHTSRGNFKFMPNEGETFYAGCHNGAELRLAIMRAVAKVKEDQDGR